MAHRKLGRANAIANGRPLPAGAQFALGLGVGVLAMGGMLAARWAQRSDLHVCLTSSGLAFVRNVPDGKGGIVRVLQQGGVFQSATYLDERRFYPPFAYLRAFERAFEAETEGFSIRRALIIGGGGFAWPKWTLARHPELQLDVAEVDPAIVRIARRYFFLDELEAQHGDRLRTFCADGRAFLDNVAHSSSSRYDLVVNDTFTGANPVRALATAEAARAAKRTLNPGGLYAANVVSHAEGSDVTFLRQAVGALRTVFACIFVVPCADEDFGGEDNYLVVATDRNLTAEGCPLAADAIPFDEDFPLPPLHDA